MGDQDVLLDVPELSVDAIELEVAGLKARVSLQAEVLDLLRLHVGIDADLEQVRLNVRGVRAQAVLKVRLDNIADILGRVFATIDANPEVARQSQSSVAQVVDQLGGGGRALNSVGRGLEQALSGVDRAVAEGARRVTEGLGGAQPQGEQGRPGEQGQQAGTEPGGVGQGQESRPRRAAVKVRRGLPRRPRRQW